jgi:stage II sporulation protein GA (sporulation sigma-E factor processing peptidase)
MVINLDLLIIENTIVNYFLLYITSQTVRVKVKWNRILLPAAVGGIYVITMVFKGLVLFTILPFKIVIAVIMVALLFRNKSFIFNMKALGIYMLYSMMLAGICFFLELNNNLGLEFSSVIINYSYKKLLLSLIIIYLLINRIVVYIRDRKELSSLIFKVEIVDKGIQRTVNAFLDTGNELREPATNLPVMIVEKACMDNLVLKEHEKLFVPYSVVNGYSGNMIGFKPDHIVVYNGREKEIREVVIAFCEDKLNKYNDYNALLSRGII